MLPLGVGDDQIPHFLKICHIRVVTTGFQAQLFICTFICKLFNFHPFPFVLVTFFLIIPRCHFHANRSCLNFQFDHFSLWFPFHFPFFNFFDFHYNCISVGTFGNAVDETPDHLVSFFAVDAYCSSVHQCLQMKGPWARHLTSSGCTNAVHWATVWLLPPEARRPKADFLCIKVSS